MKVRTVCASLAPIAMRADIDVAVAHGQHRQIFLGQLLAAGREFGDRAARRGLRHLAAGVGVDLRVQHQDVHVAAAGQHVVETAVADVVRPAVAADDPDDCVHQHVRASRSAGRAGRWRIQLRPGAASSFRDALRAGSKPGCRSTGRPSADPRSASSPRHAAQALQAARARTPFCLSSVNRKPRPNSALSSNSEFDQAGPRPSAFERPRSGRQVAAVDRRATRGVGDHRAIAEQLRQQLQIRRFAAAGARARELEQRLKSCTSLTEFMFSSLRSDSRAGIEEELPVLRFALAQRRLGGHVDRLGWVSLLFLAGQASTHSPQPVQSSGATCSV